VDLGGVGEAEFDAVADCDLLILRPDLSVMVGPTRVLLVAIFSDFV
jgi:hypothetical protein